ncbi:glycine cleavage system protein GcvH [Flagellimonas sp.]|uniref:glycine cleavage system protein GcvH n=1 Tax=Flagellimonas sp. TaxID=2058762 RepID=UPI003B5275B6
MNLPKELMYTADHEWIRVEGDIAQIGITDFAQGELGDIVYVELESLDEELNEGDVFGSIEAVKTVSDVFMPVAGTVLEINEELEEDPELVNTSPYDKGWLVRVKLADSVQVNALMDVDAYKDLIAVK